MSLQLILQQRCENEEKDKGQDETNYVVICSWLLILVVLISLSNTIMIP